MAALAHSAIYDLKDKTDGSVIKGVQRVGKKLAKGTRNTRIVRFSSQARVQLIPCDQLPPRQQHMERSVSNPLRRLWVLYRIFQIGGRYYPDQRDREHFELVDPNTEWPKEWGDPPPPPSYTSAVEEWKSNESISRSLSK